MPQQKRGLGKGLGALIPTAPPADAVGRGSRSAVGRLRDGGTDRRQRQARTSRRFRSARSRRTRASRGRSSTRTRWRNWRTRSGRSACCSRWSSARSCRATTRSSWASGGGGPASVAGLTSVPAIVRDTSDDDLLRDALIENLHRRAAEPAGGSRRLPAAARRLRGHARGTRPAGRPFAAAHLEHHPAAQAAARRAEAGRRRGAERRACPGAAGRGGSAGAGAAGAPDRGGRACPSGRWRRSSPSARSPPRPPGAATGQAVGRPALRDFADRLSDVFETRVKVELGQRKGKIVVEFASLEDLERIVKTMTPDWAQPRAPEEPSRARLGRFT